MEDNHSSDSFVRDSLAILDRFRQAERELDARPDVRRHTTTADLTETAGRMGGLPGAMLARQLRKVAVTSEELEAF